MEKRTTFRLDYDLHQKLRALANRKQTTADELVNIAIESYLVQEGVLRQRWHNADDWGPDLAELFLQFLPTPAVIKRAADFSIGWFNLAMSQLLQKQLRDARGKSLKELNLGTDFLLEIASKNMAKALRSEGPTKDIEELVLPSGSISFRAERFAFGDKQWLGDFSFVQREIHVQDLKEWKPGDVLSYIRKSPPPGEMADALVQFVHESPTATVIKEAEDPQLIIYCNEAYKKLANGREPGSGAEVDPRGKTVQQVFGLSDNDIIVTNDHRVRDAKVALCEKAQLPPRFSTTERWSYRFPILSRDGEVRFVASISPDFLND